MPFRFRLESVLRHRLWVEEERRRELGALKGTLERERMTLKEMEGELEGSREELKARLEFPEGISSDQASLYVEYFLGQSRAIEEKADLCRELAIGVERKRQELIQASIARRTLERMKEKLRERYEREAERRERKFSDELGLRQHMRKEEEAWVQ